MAQEIHSHKAKYLDANSRIITPMVKRAKQASAGEFLDKYKSPIWIDDGVDMLHGIKLTSLAFPSPNQASLGGLSGLGTAVALLGK